MNTQNQFSWAARARSFKFAAQGIKTLIIEEHNARIHCVAASLAVIAGFITHISSIEWCIIILLIGGVFALEALNSAIEALADIISPEFHPLIKKAKDTAAAAVLCMAIVALIIAAIIFIPKFYAFFQFQPNSK